MTKFDSGEIKSKTPAWKMSSLAEHVEMISGVHIEASLSNDSGAGVPYLTGPADFEGDFAVASRYTEWPQAMCESGDILVTVKGSGAGRVAIATENACISRQLAAIRVPAAERSFWLNIIKFNSEELRARAASGMIPGISRPDLLCLKVLVPPVTEQWKIATALDAVDESTRSTVRLIAKLERIRTAVITDSLRRLGEQCPRQSTVGNEFEIRAGITLGPARVPDRRPVGYLRVANVRRGWIDLNDVALLEEFPRDRSAYPLRAGDVLIVEGHANPHEIGRCALVGEPAIDMMYQNHLFRLRSHTLIPAFSEAWLNSSLVQEYWLHTCSSSSGLYTINSKQLAAVPILVPKVEDQEAVVAGIQDINSSLDAERDQMAKFRLIKQGLMEDLLAGRVRVTTDEDIAG